MTSEEFANWAYFLNSPFSKKGRDVLMNGWLVHIIRSIVATKTSRPKVKDSVFPFDKLESDFYRQASILRQREQSKQSKRDQPEDERRLISMGEFSRRAHDTKKRFEQAQRDYKAGKRPNRWGYYYGERMTF